MLDYTLDNAISLRKDIQRYMRMLQNVKDGRAVRLMFSNDSAACTAFSSEILSEVEINEFVQRIHQVMRVRLEERIDRLRREFEEL